MPNSPIPDSGGTASVQQRLTPTYTDPEVVVVPCTLHNQMSEESGLSAILEEILQAHLSSPNASSYESAKAKLVQERRHIGRNSRLVKVLSYEKLMLVLALVLLPLGRHFRERREFSVVWLEKSIETVMGVGFFRFIATIFAAQC